MKDIQIDFPKYILYRLVNLRYIEKYIAPSIKNPNYYIKSISIYTYNRDFDWHIC